MSFKNDQKEIALPTKSSQLRSSAAFLPRFFRTEANKKFLQSTIDQLIQPGVAEKIKGYVGRKNSKAFSSKDFYLGDVSDQRANYQLEPALVIKDNLENVIFYKDYNDYINQLSSFGVDTSNHDILNTQDMYALNPHIDWDKFVNFREYYWLPAGPQSVAVSGRSKDVIKTYTVTLGETDGFSHYIFTPDGRTANPTLNLYRGETYRFEINTPGHPIAFAIARSFTPGTALLTIGQEGLRDKGPYDVRLYGEGYDLGEWIQEPTESSITFAEDENNSVIYPDGITKFNNLGKEVAVVYVETGIIEFTVPQNAPDHLYYISKNDVDTSGLCNIFNIEENTETVNVDTEILGLKYYRSGNGIDFTNGLKISFIGNIEPETYKQGFWYVEGVGDKITLVREKDLLIPSPYTNDFQVPFDEQPFDSSPFSDASGFPTVKDYILVNRASQDKNAWSRNNRWFHRSVIEYAASVNNLSLNLDQEQRAKRPIIEFEAGLKLYNFGTYAKQDVDLVDDYTKDIFSIIEGSIGYNIDSVDLVDGMRILFIADTDPLVNGRIYKVKFINNNNKIQISLVAEEDSEPQDLETVFVKNGKTFSGKSFYFTGNHWKLAQEKLTVNQPPLFDLCCPQGNDYSNSDIFNSTSFKGSKVFSYVVNDGGVVDTELNFPLTYKNIENFGDILFECNLLSDTFTYQDNDLFYEINTSTANLKKYESRTNFKWTNAWSANPIKSRQKVLRQHIASLSNLTLFEIDMFDKPTVLNDLTVQVFVNNTLVKENVNYEFVRDANRLFVSFFENLKENDVVLLKVLTSAPKNKNGWYEIPYNLERNPLNEDIKSFTLGEVLDHVESMIEDLPQYQGQYPGASNLRDLSNITDYGKRFVKHTGPLNLAMYHITNKDYNVVKAVKSSKREYARFKRIFAEVAEKIGYDGPIKTHTDLVLEEINKDKIKTQPFYFSDMFSYGSSTHRSYTVLDSGEQFYPLTNKFDLKELSDRSVLVYHNGKQLTYKKHYDFTDEGFIYLYSNHKEDDTIDIYEYETTNGSFVPPTPTKLGFYPKFEPAVVIDDSYVTGNIDSNVASTPYKVYGQQDETTDENIGWFYPVYESKTRAIAADTAAGGTGSVFVCKLIGLNKQLYIPETLKNIATDDTEEYEEYPKGVSFIQGHDGSLLQTYKDYRDFLFLELEKRIFNNIKIEYNPSLLDINDYISGYYRKTSFSKQFIDNLLVNDFVDWTKNIDIDYTVNSFYKKENSFTYNYSSMTAPTGELLPGFWRGVYQYLYDTDNPHSRPWEMLGFTIKPTWWNAVYGPAPYTQNNTIMWSDLEGGIIREPNKQIRVVEKYARPGLTSNIPVDSKGNLKSPLETGFAGNFFFRNITQNFKFGDFAPVETAWRKSSEYPFALLTAWMLSNPAKVMSLGFDLSKTTKNLAGQLVYKSSGKFIRLEDIDFPNTYNETDKVLTSGLVNYIYNYVASNILSVYSDYKTQVKSITNQLGFKLAGFSEKDKIRLTLESRSPRQSEAGGVFVPYENYNLILNTSSPVDVVIYSGVVVEKVANGFIIRGYSQEKPYFEYYTPISTGSDRTIVVGGISEATTEWRPNTAYVKDQIVEFNLKFYRVTDNFVSTQAFSGENLIQLSELPIVGGKRATIRKNFNKNIKLRLNYGSRLSSIQDVVDFLLGYEKYLTDQGFVFDNYNTNTNEIEDWKLSVKEFLFWTTQGWAEGTTIVLSPSANKISFSRKYTVVDDLYDKFYDYSILKSDGTALEPSFNSIARNINEFGIVPKNVQDGIYHIRLPLVQKEHVVLIDNKTVFDDIIYEPSTGHRRERIEVSGYRSDNWQGSLNIPGFVFDDAKIVDWEPWKDYHTGNIIKHKQFYYTAKTNVIGSEAFDDASWIRLNKKPEPKLLTNFDYRINQFTDFYDTESDYFDDEQQTLARHLIGYQKRDYLQNLINDETSQYKFYQGFIREKGTKNAILKIFSNIENSNIDFYEEWAVQLGQYGSVDSYSQIEIEIDERNVIESPQIFEITDTRGFSNDNVYRILPSELYSKSTEFDNNFLLTTNDTEEFVLTAGYVNENDVSYIAQTIDDILNADCNQVSVNDYIWLINDDSAGWNVLQHVDTKLTLDTILNVGTRSYDNRPQKEFYTNVWISEELSVGEFIAVRSAQDFNLFGFYRIDKIYSNKLLVSVLEDNNIIDAEPVNLPISKLRSIRISDPNRFKGSLLNLFPKLPVYTRQIVRFVIIDKNELIVDARDSSYKVATTTNNLIVQLRNTADAYVKLSVDKLSLDSINNLNLLVQNKKYENQKVWIDNFANEEWAVLRNQETFSQQQILQDPVTETNTSNRFGASTSVSKDNTIMVVGDPAINNGKVYQYTRNRDTNNFVLAQEISIDQDDYYDLENSNFGKSVSLSEDGLFLAVGIPNAKNIKTRYKGNFVKSATYEKHDIIKYKEKLWKASRKIVPEDQSLDFEPFTTYENLKNAAIDKNSLNLIVTGNPGIENTTTDHILVRVPTNTYLATLKDDKVKLKWNAASLLNPNTESYEPFDGIYGGAINSTFISKEHEIFEKAEKILYIEFPNIDITQANIGDVVRTPTGLGTITYISNADNTKLFLYVDKITGILSEIGLESGIISLNDTGEVIGEYIEILNDANNELFGGYWIIKTDNTYITTNQFVENGSGLVYIDVDPKVGASSANIYKNIKDSTQPNFSFISALSYTGNPQNIPQTVNSKLWVVRSTTDFTPETNQFFKLNLYRRDNQLNISRYSLLESFFDTDIKITNTWDGYIDYTIPINLSDVYDSQGNPYEVQVGDIIQDVQVTANGLERATFTARVMFYKRVFNNLRVYVNYETNGRWRLLPGSVEVKLKRVRPGQTSRIVGIIDNTETGVVLASETIGKLLVFEHSSNLPVPLETIPYLENEEYYFYTSNTINGAQQFSLPPGDENLNYTQVYNIKADSSGNPSITSTQGAVAIYRRIPSGLFKFEKILVSEFENRTNFGKQVKITKQNNQYTLLVSSNGTPGFIEIFNHGPAINETFQETWNPSAQYSKDDIVYFEGNFYKAIRNINETENVSVNKAELWKEISWRFGKDKNYEGIFNPAYSYSVDSIVLYNGTFYSSNTNIVSTTTQSDYPPNNSNLWTALPSEVEYAGYFPGPVQSSNFVTFGEKFNVNATGDLVVVTNIDTEKQIKNVAVYRRFENYFINQLISSLYDDNSFGSALSISKSGNVLAVAEPENDEISFNQGKVYVYVYDGDRFIYNQTLVPPSNEITEKFGYSVSVGENNVAITSLNGDMKVPTTFDKFTVKDSTVESAYQNSDMSPLSDAQTTFDKGFTRFTNIKVDSGSVYIFENIQNALVFAENIYNNFTSEAYTDSAMLMFGEDLVVNDNHVYAITINEVRGNTRGKILDYRRNKGETSWVIEQQKISAADANKIHEIFLYNKKTNSILTYIDFIDPVQGKIAGPAEQELTYKTKFDPASYTINELGIATGKTSVWGKEHVGEVWWKIDSAKFANAYHGSMQYQKSEWNKILSGDIEIYEWVESKNPPSVWDKISDTEAGLLQGISGKSVYGDANYTEKFVYDSVSQTFTSVYYFWVKDKKVIPDVKSRRVSIFDVKNLIKNPRLQGYRFVNFLSSNSFVLNNCDSFIKDKDTILCIRYNTGKKDIQNIHTEYQLVSDGLETSLPHSEVELKWFNSLIGFDINKRPVPDLNLSVRDKYGIQSDPRQSMFVNRQEALKQTIERINSVLIKNPIVDNYNIQPLTLSDLPPSEKSNKFDRKVDQIEELRFVRTSQLKPAVLSPVIQNGKIIRVQIIEPGFGYAIPPLAEIYGSGSDAQIDITIDSKGMINGVIVLNPGQGYNSNTSIFVRKYSILVNSDSSNFGKWSIYSWDEIQKTWFRTLVQEYDVKKFWNYVDWYADGYNEFTIVKRIIDGSYQLSNQVDRIGDIVKINNVGSGGWVLLEKISNDITSDYTINYKTVGRQNGTIQFLDTLYDYSKNTIGFDNRSFDSFVYDNVPIVELRTILETIRDYIFVGELRAEYNQLFIAALRYVLSEQPYVDWLFKTSFIRVEHSAGELTQDITFNAEILDDYQKYVEEVKPYSTTIRDFVSSYNKLENTNSYITDFDVPPFYNTESKKIEVNDIKVENNKLVGSLDTIDQNIIENLGFSIVDVVVANGGENFSSDPIIDVVGGGGTGAKLKAYVRNQKISYIEILDGGKGYVSQPELVIRNLPDTSNAKLFAVLGNSKIKKSMISMKYDRYSKKETITSLTRTENFVGTGSQVIYNLEWPIDTARKNISVFVDNTKLLKSEYSYYNEENKEKSYTRKQGAIRFTNPPKVDSQIRIEYKVSTEVLNSIDRINFFYKPTSGMLGVTEYVIGNTSIKDYSQLISGIDYGGVEITGIDFNTNTGWNSNVLAGPWNAQTEIPTLQSDFDMIIRGGNIAYTTAQGINPEEIIVDGDQIISPISNIGPEELVPGQTYDSVNIVVTTRAHNNNNGTIEYLADELFTFSIFKDMLNRTHYKKYIVTTQLAQSLAVADTSIEVVDATNLPEPDQSNNIPGIIFVDKERIEYFVKNGNTLSQLRRGTLGTGIKDLYPADEKVINQGTLTNMPYRDNTQIQKEIGNGETSIFALDFEKTFVLGNQQIYSQNEFEVFVGGIRLKKSNWMMFDNSLEKMDSPEGDTEIEKDYTIDNTTNSIIFAVPPPAGQTINIVRKLGRTWSNSNTALEDSVSDTAIFLKSQTS